MLTARTAFAASVILRYEQSLVDYITSCLCDTNGIPFWPTRDVCHVYYGDSEVLGGIAAIAGFPDILRARHTDNAVEERFLLTALVSSSAFLKSLPYVCKMWRNKYAGQSTVMHSRLSKPILIALSIGPNLPSLLAA